MSTAPEKGAPQDPAQAWSPWWLTLVGLLLGLALMEGLLRAYHALTGDVPPHTDPAVREEWQWAARHLAAGSAVLPGTARHDPFLGWVNPAHIDTGKVRTNSIGMRGEREFDVLRRGGTPRMILVGDSYTFGAYADEHSAFHAVLSRDHLPGWEILNLGVGGYGPDQALLMYERLGARYRPDVVVYGFYVRGFNRLFTAFRYYAKPYFELGADGELRLRNVPVISPLRLYAGYRSGRRRIGGWNYSYLHAALWSATERALRRRRGLSRRERSWRLMAAILKRLHHRAMAAGSCPFLLIFPTRSERFRGTIYEDVDRLAQAEARRLGMPFLALSGPFEARERAHRGRPLQRPPETGGHLSREGNRLVARTLFEALRDAGLLATHAALGGGAGQRDSYTARQAARCSAAVAAPEANDTARRTD